MANKRSVLSLVVGATSPDNQTAPFRSKNLNLSARIDSRAPFTHAERMPWRIDNARLPFFRLLRKEFIVPFGHFPPVHQRLSLPSRLPFPDRFRTGEDTQEANIKIGRSILEYFADPGKFGFRSLPSVHVAREDSRGGIRACNEMSGEEGMLQ